MDIEEAEKLCLEWNGVKVSENNFLKAHIHPLSYRKRPASKRSHNSIFDNFYTVEDENSNVKIVKIPTDPKSSDLKNQLTSSM